MQPSGREMHGGGGQDDFFNQMLSTLPAAWPELGSSKSPWELPVPAAGGAAPSDDPSFDDSILLASRLRHHQISCGGDNKPSMLHLGDLHRHGLAAAEDFLPMPPFTDRSREGIGGDEALYNGFGAAGIHGAVAAVQPPFVQGGSMLAQSFGGGAAAAGSGLTPTSAGAAGAAAPLRQQRVRARRGQATDPHSIAERLRRERIAERMKALQEMVPNANKTDKASMLDEIIDYVKFLQLQVKVLSMSRLGGAAAVAPLVANMSSSEGDGNGNDTSSSGNGNATNGNGIGDDGSNAMRVTEEQVARLMEEDMASAMQYLQGKGLCLMPVSLASAISTTTSSSFLPRLSPGGSLHEDGSPRSAPLVNGTTSGDIHTIRKASAGGKL